MIESISKNILEASLLPLQVIPHITHRTTSTVNYTRSTAMIAIVRFDALQFRNVFPLSLSVIVCD